MTDNISELLKIHLDKTAKCKEINDQYRNARLERNEATEMLEKALREAIGFCECDSAYVLIDGVLIEIPYCDDDGDRESGIYFHEFETLEMLTKDDEE